MDAVAVVRIALGVISDRLLTVLALGLCFSLCCWTMWDPKYERVIVVALFSVYSYILLIKMESKDERYRNQTKEI